MMMRILHAGGMPCLYKEHSDSDNPGGYFETGGRFNFHLHPEQMFEAEGKALKIILPPTKKRIDSLPFGHEYRCILMQRPSEEVLISQLTVAINRGCSVMSKSFIERFEIKHGNTQIETDHVVTDASELLVRTADEASLELGASVMAVPYHDVLKEPREVAEAIVKFLGVPLDIGAMIRQVDQKLYRNRK